MNKETKSEPSTHAAPKRRIDAGVADASSEPRQVSDNELDAVQGGASKVWEYIRKNSLQDKIKRN